MTNREVFLEKMNALSDAINEKAETSGKKTIDELIETVESIEPGITPTGNVEITTTEETDVTEYATAQVVEENLVAGNIKKDVSILGVVGTLEEGITPTGKVNLTNTTETDVTQYATAQVVDANLVASNIKKDVSVLGITGSYEGTVPSGTYELDVVQIEGNADVAGYETVHWTMTAHDEQGGVYPFAEDTFYKLYTDAEPFLKPVGRGTYYIPATDAVAIDVQGDKNYYIDETGEPEFIAWGHYYIGSTGPARELEPGLYYINGLTGLHYDTPGVYSWDGEFGIDLVENSVIQIHGLVEEQYYTTLDGACYSIVGSNATAIPNGVYEINGATYTPATPSGPTDPGYYNLDEHGNWNVVKGAVYGYEDGETVVYRSSGSDTVCWFMPGYPQGEPSIAIEPGASYFIGFDGPVHLEDGYYNLVGSYYGPIKGPLYGYENDQGGVTYQSAGSETHCWFMPSYTEGQPAEDIEFYKTYFLDSSGPINLEGTYHLVGSEYTQLEAGLYQVSGGTTPPETVDGGYYQYLDGKLQALSSYYTYYLDGSGAQELNGFYHILGSECFLLGDGAYNITGTNYDVLDGYYCIDSANHIVTQFNMASGQMWYINGENSHLETNSLKAFADQGQITDFTNMTVGAEETVTLVTGHQFKITRIQ